MPDLHPWFIVAIITLVTAALRFIPFLVFSREEKVPPFIKKLSRLLPCAVMGMLVIYCLKDVSFQTAAGFLPALIACLVVGALYVWKRNTLLSIVAGTVSYMLLVQFAF